MGITEAPAAVDCQCHVCGTPNPTPVPRYGQLYRVSSDCRPAARGGRLCVCRACGAVQKVIDTAWNSEVEQIYDSYSIYYQAAGAEQAVFDVDSSRSVRRSRHLLDRLRSKVSLPAFGRLLDLGCGNGALLRAFSDLEPRWSLVGTELNDKYRSEVERIEHVEALHTCMPIDVPGPFDLITMVHVLEHIPSPIEFLAKLRTKLKKDGVLVIEVPHYVENPFDLIVADHSTHFDLATLRRVLEAAGYRVLESADDWLPKELTVVALQAESTPPIIYPTSAVSIGSAAARIAWLHGVLASARRAACAGSLGIFGTSIAATWLQAELDDKVDFFVDEDPSRVGRMFFDRPVFLPRDAPPEGAVFVALPPHLAANVVSRLRRLLPNRRFDAPPNLTEWEGFTT